MDLTDQTDALIQQMVNESIQQFRKLAKELGVDTPIETLAVVVACLEIKAFVHGMTAGFSAGLQSIGMPEEPADLIAASQFPREAIQASLNNILDQIPDPDGQ